MVATSMHYIVGVLLAHLLGIKDHRKFWIGLIAIIPDLDGILIAILMLIRSLSGVSMAWLEHSQTAVTLFAHRGISHSLLLLAVVLVFFIRKKQLLKTIAILWGSHLFLDFITSWKMFPLLPLSFQPAYFGLVEVFDPLLTFFTTILFAFLLISTKVSRSEFIFSYFFILFFGFFSSVFMNEYNLQTIVLSQGLFWVIIAAAHFSKKFQSFSEKGIHYLFLIIIGYLFILTAGKMLYATQLSISPIHIEPLEQFDFNYNAHTFEMEQGDSYRIGIISLRGIEQDTTVQKVMQNDPIKQETINEFLTAYEKALHTNWFNYPVWNFHRDEEGIVYANIRYAKSYLDTPYIPGPKNGMNIKLENGLLVPYGDSWFD